MRLRFIPLLSGRRRMMLEVPLRTPSPWVTLLHRFEFGQNVITGRCKTRASTRATECDTKGFIVPSRQEAELTRCQHGQSRRLRRKPYNGRVDRVRAKDQPFQKTLSRPPRPTHCYFVYLPHGTSHQSSSCPIPRNQTRATSRQLNMDGIVHHR